VFGVKISGLLAWFMWRTIYLSKMPGWGRRVKVASAWALDLVLPPDIVELRLGDSRGMAQAHFEPGEDVFHQGDVGDRIYYVLKGQAEVLRQRPGGDELIALLGPGDWFGEGALLNETTRGATVRCRLDLDVLSLPKKDFAVLASSLPDVRRSFDEILERRGLRKVAVASEIPDPVACAPAGRAPSP
jgi:NADH:ubiquinone reductase (H+-translocating)